MSSSAPPRLSSRRDVVTGLAAGAAIAGIGTSPALAATRLSAVAVGVGGLEHAGIDEWQRHVGSDFVVRSAGGGTALTLVAVEPGQSEGRRPADVGRGHSFTAVFEARAPGIRGDRTYAVSHRTAGLMPIYFSPAAGGGRIVALFN